MERTAKIFSRTLCWCITAATAVIGYFYAALPAAINFDGINYSGSLSAAVLRQNDGVCSFYVGAIPIKETSAVAVERPRLVVCGTPFGIKLRSEGVMVVSVKENSPAAAGGLKKGDIILAVNGSEVRSCEELSAALLTENSITVRRGDSELCVSCSAKTEESGGAKRIGAWVRDSAAGIGTMTFYDPESGVFGGLGHAVSDVTTGDLVPLASGEITAADIYDVVKGEKGCAGELCGALFAENVTGALSANTPVGVFGRLNNAPDGEVVPIAFRQEVKPGGAYILTTIDGSAPRAYSIEIERINLLGVNTSKGMVIRITDPELIKKTGGIVRGMSGSPIIQDGRLVGAVTHVLVNDPERGYAVFAESMLEEMNRAA